MDNDIRREIIAKSPISYSGLRKLNIWAGIFLLIPGIIMVALGYILDWKQAIYTFYLKFKIISLAPPSFQIQLLHSPSTIWELFYLHSCSYQQLHFWQLHF